MREIKCFVLLPVLSRNESIFHSESLYQSLENLNHFREFLHNYQKMIEIVEREKGAKIIYDAENIKEFQQQMNGLDDEFMSLQYAFYTLLSNAENCRDNSKRVADSRYFLWDLNQFIGIQINSSISTLAEIAEQKRQDENKKLVLMHNDSIHLDRSIIPIIKDGSNEKCPSFICIEQVKNSTELENWICQNRQPRWFNLNPKHGEKGKGAKANKGEEVSVLLCDRKRAQELLESAIGDKRITKKLFNFDNEFQQFIVFEDENTLNNTYHGYHIDNENESEVPKNIREDLLTHCGC
jgi:hypothetical protein